MPDDSSPSKLMHALSRLRDKYLVDLANIRCLGIQDGDEIAREDIGQSRLLKDAYSIKQEDARRQRAEGEAHAEAQASAKPPEPTRENQLLDDLLARRRKRLFITGDGGIGKTEFTRHLAHHLALHLAPGDPRSLVPCLVTLKNLSSKDSSFVKRLARFAGPLTPAGLHQLAKQGRVAFILDGLDELNARVTREEFDGDLSYLMDKYPESTIVLAGRQGSLVGLADKFKEPDTFTLQPLSSDDITRYISGYFKAIDRSADGTSLVNAVRTAGAVMRPILTQPFLLALTCIRFRDRRGNFNLPDDRASLINDGLTCLFERREEVLQLDPDACFDSLGALFAESIDRIYEIGTRQDAIKILSTRTGVSQEIANQRMAQLTPGSGLLMKSAGSYRPTNRVIADYLAACWIAKHGWSGPGCGPSAVTPNDHVPATIRKFYSHYVWSNDHRNLLRWLGFVLAKSTQGADTLMRLIRWLAAHLQGPAKGDPKKPLNDASAPWRDDQYRSLLHRYLDLLSAIRPETEAYRHPSIDQAKATFLQIVPSGGDWHHDLGVESVTSLPADWIDRHGHTLRKKLRDEANGHTVAYIARALASGWLRDKETGDALLEKLRDCKDANAVTSLAEELASHWPEHKAAAGHALREKLRDEREYFSVLILAHALASHWPEHKAAAGHALWEKLRDERFFFSVTLLAKMLASGWPEHKAAAGHVVREKLRDETDGRAVAEIVRALASGWRGDKETGDALLEKLRDCKDANAVTSLAQELASHWPEHKAAAGHALREKLRDETDGQTVAYIARALASHWPEHKAAAGHALREKLLDETDGRAVEEIARALASHWPEHQAAAGHALRKKLRDETDGRTVAEIAQALASGWRGDKEAGHALRQKLRDETDGVAVAFIVRGLASGWPEHKAAAGHALREKLRNEKSFVSIALLAQEIAFGWRGDKESGDALLEKLRDKDIGNTAAEQLAEFLALGWPGDCNTLRMLRRRVPDKLKNVWPDWVIVFGPLDGPADGHGLRQWAERCGWIPPLKSNPPDGSIPASVIESFHLGPLDKPDPLANFQNPDNPKKNAATPGQNEREFGFILAPREKLRPGLDPLLDPDQPTGDATAKPASKGGFPRVWETLVPIIEKHIKEHPEPVLTPRALAKHLHNEGKTEATHHYKPVKRALVAVLKKFSETEDFKHLVDLWTPKGWAGKSSNYEGAAADGAIRKHEAELKDAPKWKRELILEVINSKEFRALTIEKAEDEYKTLMLASSRSEMSKFIAAFEAKQHSQKRRKTN